MESTDAEKPSERDSTSGTKETSEEKEEEDVVEEEKEEDASTAKVDQTAPAEEHDGDVAAMAAVPAPSARIDSETGESEEAATTTPADS